MPLARLYKDTHKLGYNTRDNPQDIPFEACQALVNCFPGDPSPQPRFGTDRWNTNILSGAVKRAFPWVDDSAPKVILHIGDGLYWQAAGGGAITAIDASIVPATSKLSAIRIKDQLLVNNNLTAASHRAWFLAWDGTTFTIRNANIVRPFMQIGVVDHPVGDIGPLQFVGMAFTLVNRTDAASVDGSGDPKLCTVRDGNFHPGLLESVEDLDNRTWYTQGGATQGLQWVVEILGGAAALDPQVTHLRYYRTEAAASEAAARGLQHRWHADIPLVGPNAYVHPWTYEDEFLAGETAGSLDVSKAIGYEPIPPGTYLLHHQGRVWVGGVGSGEEVGRHFYSEVPLDVEFPHKWWTMFRLGTYFKDTAYEDAEPAMAAAVAGNDLILFNKKSLWYLRDGDVDFEPAMISRTKGTAFPNSITIIDKAVAYLSNEGPAVVSIREAEAMGGHTAGEVWPKVHDNSTGYFHGLADKTLVYGFYFQETWWLTDGVKLIGMFLPSMAKAGGPLSVEFADTDIGFGIPCVLNSETLCLLMSRTAAGYIWSFLNKAVHTDDGTNFMLKCKSKAMYVSRKDRDRCGEGYNLKVFAHFEDSATFYLEFISDFFRFTLEMAYNEHGSEVPVTSPGSRVSFRNLMEQPIPEGIIFSFCEIVWRKEHRTPFSFKNSGFILEYLPKDGHVSEFISRSQGDGLVVAWPDYIFYGRFDDNSDTLTDFSLNERHHAWANGTGGSRTHDASLVPDGGQSAVGGSGSGWSDADWTGMDYIGDEAGLNSEDLTYEYVANFPTLAAAQVIQEGGDGVYYWRLRVNADGSLEYLLATSTLAYSFVTPAGTIVSGATQYTIQFVLSNGGHNGQFYAAARNGAFASITTTRSDI